MTVLALLLPRLSPPGEDLEQRSSRAPAYCGRSDEVAQPAPLGAANHAIFPPELGGGECGAEPAAGTGGPAVGSGRRGAGRSGGQGGLEASSWSCWRYREDLE